MPGEPDAHCAVALDAEEKAWRVVTNQPGWDTGAADEARWNEVVDEFGAGALSDKNWKYLHGLPVHDCPLSEAERQSRKRVISDPRDASLNTAAFLMKDDVLPDIWAQHVTVRDPGFLKGSLRVEKATKRNLTVAVFDQRKRGSLQPGG